MTDPIRAALERLIARLDETTDPSGPVPAWSDSFYAARAALAQSAPPAEGEVASEARYLTKELRDQADDLSPSLELFGLMHRAADLLQQCHPAPVPVPVSERMPGDALCWWYEPDEDEDGSCYGGSWTLLRIRGAVSCYTHWLPAHSLPLPAGEVQP